MDPTTVPPAEAERQRRESARSTYPPSHIPVLQVAFELVQQAEAAGIPMLSASTYGDGDYATIGLFPVLDDDAPLLANLLGLTDRHVTTYPAEVDTSVERWQGRVGPAYVTTSHKIKTPMAVAS